MARHVQGFRGFSRELGESAAQDIDCAPARARAPPGLIHGLSAVLPHMSVAIGGIDSKLVTRILGCESQYG